MKEREEKLLRMIKDLVNVNQAIIILEVEAEHVDKSLKSKVEELYLLRKSIISMELYNNDDTECDKIHDLN
ncbi:MAG: hypothetical protein ACFFG0_54280 [Candidatus Thorarchaeota archaeon]